MRLLPSKQMCRVWQRVLARRMNYTASACRLGKARAKGRRQQGETSGLLRGSNRKSVHKKGAGWNGTDLHRSVAWHALVLSDRWAPSPHDQGDNEEHQKHNE